VLFRKAKNLVGLDIGSSAVKLVELKEGKDGTFQLAKAGLEILSPEAIVDGAIMDSSLVVETISRLLASTGVKNPNVAVSVSGHSVIVKKIMLPTMPEEELSESIRWEAEQYVPFDINDVYLDYVVLDPGAAGETMGVLLVAAKKEKVDDFKNVVTQAGRTPSLVDVDAFALQKAYSLNFEQAESLKRGEPVAGQTAQTIQPVLTGVAEDAAAELQKTLDFFQATSGADRVDSIMISGGGAKAAHLEDVLKDKFGLPVEILNPFRSILTEDRAIDAAWLAQVSPSLAIAVGLGVRKIGE